MNYPRFHAIFLQDERKTAGTYKALFFSPPLTPAISL